MKTIWQTIVRCWSEKRTKRYNKQRIIAFKEILYMLYQRRFIPIILLSQQLNFWIHNLAFKVIKLKFDFNRFLYISTQNANHHRKFYRKSITTSIINQNPYESNLGARKFRDLFMKKNLNSDTNQRLKKTYKPFYMSDDD